MKTIFILENLQDSDFTSSLVERSMRSYICMLSYVMLYCRGRAHKHALQS